MPQKNNFKILLDVYKLQYMNTGEEIESLDLGFFKLGKIQGFIYANNKHEIQSPGFFIRRILSFGFCLFSIVHIRGWIFVEAYIFNYLLLYISQYRYCSQPSPGK
jgi:hypothetical protein